MTTNHCKPKQLVLIPLFTILILSFSSPSLVFANDETGSSASAPDSTTSGPSGTGNTGGWEPRGFIDKIIKTELSIPSNPIKSNLVGFLKNNKIWAQLNLPWVKWLKQSDNLNALIYEIETSKSRPLSEYCSTKNEFGQNSLAATSFSIKAADICFDIDKITKSLNENTSADAIVKLLASIFLHESVHHLQEDPRIDKLKVKEVESLANGIAALYFTLADGAAIQQIASNYVDVAEAFNTPRPQFKKVTICDIKCSAVGMPHGHDYEKIGEVSFAPYSEANAYNSNTCQENSKTLPILASRLEEDDTFPMTTEVCSSWLSRDRHFSSRVDLGTWADPYNNELFITSIVDLENLNDAGCFSPTPATHVTNTSTKCQISSYQIFLHENNAVTFMNYLRQAHIPEDENHNFKIQSIDWNDYTDRESEDGKVTKGFVMIQLNLEINNKKQSLSFSSKNKNEKLVVDSLTKALELANSSLVNTRKASDYHHGFGVRDIWCVPKSDQSFESRCDLELTRTH